MSEVRVVQLGPLHVASFYGFSQEPEQLAWRKLTEWARPRGFLDDVKHHRIFGFNNPTQSPGSPNYGYELWMVVGPETAAEGEMELKDFAGGLYAVARCDAVGDEYQTIPAAWEKLMAWQAQSKYKFAGHQWLEEHLRPEGKGVVTTAGGEWMLDLYLPIGE